MTPEQKKKSILQLRTDLTPQAAKIFREFKAKKGLANDSETIRLLLTEYRELEHRLIRLEQKEQFLQQKELLLLKILAQVLLTDQAAQKAFEAFEEEERKDRK